MKTPFATALLIGVGFVPEMRAFTSHRRHEKPAVVPVVHRTVTTVSRRPDFGHLASAGRFSRHEVASFWFEDGRLWADWAGNVQAPEPQRIETEELDAEWMVLTPSASPSPDNAGRWLLARRDLQPFDDGRFWSVQCYGSESDPGGLHLLATADRVNQNGEPETLHVSYSQRERMVQFATWRQRGTRRLGAIDLVAADMQALAANRPHEVRAYLAPAISKIAGVELI